MQRCALAEHGHLLGGIGDVKSGQGQVRQRIGRGMHRGSSARRTQPPCQGLPRRVGQHRARRCRCVAGGLEMVCQLGRISVCGVAVQCLDRLGGLQVQMHPVRRREPLVEHPAVERMAKAVTAAQRAVRKGHQAAGAEPGGQANQLVGQLLHARPGLSHHPRQQQVVELLAHRRSRLQHSPQIVRHGLDLTLDHAHHRVRQLQAGQFSVRV